MRALRRGMETHAQTRARWQFRGQKRWPRSEKARLRLLRKVRSMVSPLVAVMSVGPPTADYVKHWQERLRSRLEVLSGEWRHRVRPAFLAWRQAVSEWEAFCERSGITWVRPESEDRVQAWLIVGTVLIAEGSAAGYFIGQYMEDPILGAIPGIVLAGLTFAMAYFAVLAARIAQKPGWRARVVGRALAAAFGLSGLLGILFAAHVRDGVESGEIDLFGLGELGGNGRTSTWSPLEIFTNPLGFEGFASWLLLISSLAAYLFLLRKFWKMTEFPELEAYRRAAQEAEEAARDAYVQMERDIMVAINGTASQAEMMRETRTVALIEALFLIDLGLERLGVLNPKIVSPDEDEITAALRQDRVAVQALVKENAQLPGMRAALAIVEGDESESGSPREVDELSTSVKVAEGVRWLERQLRKLEGEEVVEEQESADGEE